MTPCKEHKPPTVDSLLVAVRECTPEELDAEHPPADVATAVERIAELTNEPECAPTVPIDLATARAAHTEDLATRSELAALLRQVTQDRDAFADRCVELQRRVTELELEAQCR
jgi:hypothetical protein